MKTPSKKVNKVTELKHFTDTWINFMVSNFMQLFTDSKYMLAKKFRHFFRERKKGAEKETIKVYAFPWKLNSQQQIPIIILFSWLLHYSNVKWESVVTRRAAKKAQCFVNVEKKKFYFPVRSYFNLIAVLVVEGNII